MAWQRFHNVFTNIKDDMIWYDIVFIRFFFLLFSLSHKSHFYIIAGYPPGTWNINHVSYLFKSPLSGEKHRQP